MTTNTSQIATTWIANNQNKNRNASYFFKNERQLKHISTEQQNASETYNIKTTTTTPNAMQEIQKGNAGATIKMQRENNQNDKCNWTQLQAQFISILYMTPINTQINREVQITFFNQKKTILQKYQFHFSSAPNAFEFVPHNHRTSCRTNRDGIEYNFILNVPTIHNSTHTMEKDRIKSRRAFEQTLRRSKNSPSYLSSFRHCHLR